VKIVLDTNIIVSGLLQPLGNPAKVLTLALAGAVQVCHEKRILAEYADVLARPRFKFDPKRVREVLTKLAEDGQPIDTKGQPDLDLPDPDDEPFLAAALSAKVDYLVTGNLADYPARSRRGCAVVSPAEFMEVWRKLTREPQSACAALCLLRRSYVRTRYAGTLGTLPKQRRGGEKVWVFGFGHLNS
jgi:putative PIN family toxin of toxin-antitoxin system